MSPPGRGDDTAWERRYRALTEAVSDGLVELDASLRIVAVNQRFLDMVGYTRDELIGTLPPHPYWPTESFESFEQGTASALTAAADEHPLTLVHKDGTPLPVMVWVSPLKGPGGEPAGVLGLVRDLTATKRLEARYRALVQRSADLIVVVDADARVTFVSPSVRTVLGWDPVDLAAEGGRAVTDILEFVHPDDLPAASALVGTAPHTGDTSGRIEVRARHADGSWRWLEVVVTNLLADPAVDGYVFNARDVTDRRGMEHELRAGEERFRSTIESMLDGVVVYSAIRDANGQIVDLLTEHVNRAVVQHSGMPPEEQIGRTMKALFPLTAVEPARFEPFVRVIETGEPVRFETEYRDDRTSGLFELQVQKLGDGCVLTFREVSEERRAAAVRVQLERERLLDQMRRADRLESVGRLAAGVAHDLANSLAAIRNFAAAVANGLGPDHPLTADVDQVVAIATQAAALTEGVLDLGGPGRKDEEPVEPDVLVDEVLEVVQRSLDSVRLERGPERTRRVVIAARHQLEQVLVNLLLNAVDASEPEATVTVRVLDLGGGLDDRLGPRVGLEVTDTGAGMTPEVAARAFDPFFTTKPVGQGTGLGLATVHGIVDALGGTVRIESEPGRGTSVLVVLPAVERGAESATPGARGSAAGRA